MALEAALFALKMLYKFAKMVKEAKDNVNFIRSKLCSTESLLHVIEKGVNEINETEIDEDTMKELKIRIVKLRKAIRRMKMKYEPLISLLANLGGNAANLNNLATMLRRGIIGVALAMNTLSTMVRRHMESTKTKMEEFIKSAMEGRAIGDIQTILKDPTSVPKKIDAVADDKKDNSSKKSLPKSKMFQSLVKYKLDEIKATTQATNVPDSKDSSVQNSITSFTTKTNIEINGLQHSHEARQLGAEKGSVAIKTSLESKDLVGINNYSSEPIVTFVDSSSSHGLEVLSIQASASNAEANTRDAENSIERNQTKENLIPDFLIEPTEELNDAATSIQKIIRGRQVRKTVNSAENSEENVASDIENQTDSPLSDAVADVQHMNNGTDLNDMNTVTNEPVMNVVGDERIMNAITDENVTEAVTNEPVMNVVGDERIMNAITDENVTEAVTNEPVTDAVSDEHVMNAVTDEHLNAITDENVTDAVNNEPITVAVSDEHVMNAVADEHVINAFTANEPNTDAATDEHVMDTFGQQKQQVMSNQRKQSEGSTKVQQGKGTTSNQRKQSGDTAIAQNGNYSTANSFKQQSMDAANQVKEQALQGLGISSLNAMDTFKQEYDRVIGMLDYLDGLIKELRRVHKESENEDDKDKDDDKSNDPSNYDAIVPCDDGSESKENCKQVDTEKSNFLEEGIDIIMSQITRDGSVSIDENVLSKALGKGSTPANVSLYLRHLGDGKIIPFDKMKTFMISEAVVNKNIGMVVAAICSSAIKKLNEIENIPKFVVKILQVALDLTTPMIKLALQFGFVFAIETIREVFKFDPQELMIQQREQDEAKLEQRIELLQAFAEDLRDSVEHDLSPDPALMASIAIEVATSFVGMGPTMKRRVEILISISNICNVEHDKKTIEEVNNDIHHEMIVIQALHSNTYADHVSTAFDARKSLGENEMSKFWVTSFGKECYEVDWSRFKLAFIAYFGRTFYKDLDRLKVHIVDQRSNVTVDTIRSTTRGNAGTLNDFLRSVNPNNAETVAANMKNSKEVSFSNGTVDSGNSIVASRSKSSPNLLNAVRGSLTTPLTSLNKMNGLVQKMNEGINRK